MPSRASADANKVYRSVGLKWNEAPLPTSEQATSWRNLSAIGLQTTP